MAMGAVWVMRAGATLNPSARRHVLCASMYSVQDSSPLCIMHSSLTLRVSGHAQQIRHFGFASSAGAPVLALLSDAAGTESGIATRHFQASQRCSRGASRAAMKRRARGGFTLVRTRFSCDRESFTSCVDELRGQHE